MAFASVGEPTCHVRPILAACQLPENRRPSSAMLFQGEASYSRRANESEVPRQDIGGRGGEKPKLQLPVYRHLITLTIQRSDEWILCSAFPRVPPFSSFISEGDNGFGLRI